MDDLSGWTEPEMRSDRLAVAIAIVEAHAGSLRHEGIDRECAGLLILQLGPLSNRRPASCCRNRNIGSRLFAESPTSSTFFASSICRTTGKLKDTRQARAVYIKQHQ